jgi:hypothetical protein
MRPESVARQPLTLPSPTLGRGNSETIPDTQPICQDTARIFARQAHAGFDEITTLPQVLCE